MKTARSVARLALLAVVAVSATTARLGYAATYYWDNNGATDGFGTAGGTWGTGAGANLWTSSSVGNIAVAGFATTTLDDLNLGTASDGLATGTITLGGVGGRNAGTITVGSASGIVTLANLTVTYGDTPVITVNGSAQLAHGSNIAGAGTSLTKNGTGLLNSSSLSSYTGATVLNDGILQVATFANANAVSSIGTPSGNSTAATFLVLNGGTLRKVGGTSSSTNRLFTLGGSSSIESGAGNTLNFTNAGSIAATGAAARTLTLTGAGTGIGSLTPNLNDATGGGGVVSLVKNGTGTWTVSGASSNFSGGTTVAAGTLTMGSASALGSTSGQLTVNGGTLDMAGNNLNVGNLTGTGGTISGTSGTRMLTIGQGNGTGGNFQGAIANGSGGTTALTKTGNGTITLSGVNTYTGATAINDGTLLINGSLAAGSGVTVGASGTLGGTGAIGGSVAFNGTSLLAIVNLADPLIVANSGNTFGAGFGIDNLTGIDWDTLDLNTTYTALSTSQVFSSSDVDNFGFANRTGVGGTGREGYFTNGSLAFVVVPEPGTLALLACGGAVGAAYLRRRSRGG